MFTPECEMFTSGKRGSKTSMSRLTFRRVTSSKVSLPKATMLAERLP